jgi:ABC-type branched-subunit amino acid transport system substrate-binding protein
MSKTAKWIVAIIVIILIVAGVWYWQTNKVSTPAETGPIKIGSILSMTGFGANIANNEMKGLTLALEDLKKDGYDVNLVVEDSAGLADKAASAANKLISIDQVDALFVDLTAPSGAVAPIGDRLGRVVLYDAFDPKIVEENDLSVKTFFDAGIECRNFANYAKKNNIQKVAYLGPKLPFAEQCVSELKNILGENSVFVGYTLSPTDTDYRTQILKAKDFGAQFIASVAYEGNYISIFKQKTELGFSVPVFCTLSDCLSEKVIESTSQESLEGVIGYTFAIDEEFKKFIATRYPEATSADYELISVGYDSLNYLVRSISLCEKNDSACIISEMKKTKNYQSKVASSGFSDKRVFQPISNYFEYKDGKLSPVDILSK